MKAKLEIMIFMLVLSGALSAQNPPKNFKGDIKLDIRDSKGDWPAFLENKAPKDAAKRAYYFI